MSTDTPAQWRMVPVEPTVDMQIAGAGAIAAESGDEIDATVGEVAAAYRAMLAAAPQPAQEPVAWRYTDSRGNYRYRGYVAGFDKEYSILKPVPLYAAPAQASGELVEALRISIHTIREDCFPIGWNIDRLKEVLARYQEKP